MNTIKEYLNQYNISISLDHSNISFFAAWEIKSIIENPIVIEELYKFHPLEAINTIDDFYLYFLTCKIVTFSDAVPSLVQEDHKEIITKVVALAREQLNIINRGLVIKFINSHIEDIFECEDSSDYQNVTIEFIAKNNSGIAENIWEYLAKQHGYLLLNYYADFEKKIESNPCLFKLIFSPMSLGLVESFGFDTVMDIWTHIIHKKESKLKEIVRELNEQLYPEMVALASNATIDNVLLIETKTTRYFNFLKSINSPMANTFSQTDKSIQDLLTKNITEKGQHFEYEIPVKEIVDNWKSTKIWELRLLTLTHERILDNESVDMVSRLNAGNSIPSAFLDMIKTNVPTDKDFPLSKQQGLSLLSNILSGTIAEIIINSDTLMDYLSQITSAVHFLSEKRNINDDSLDKDAYYLINQIKSISDCYRDSERVKLISYGASMFSLAFAEKILRLTYIDISKNDLYVPENKGTLGELLNEGNHYIVGIFGINHIKCLTYFLLQTPSTKIGYNTRNALAHWNGISIDNMNLQFFSRCLWLFTDILNTVFWYYIKRGEDFESKA